MRVSSEHAWDGEAAEFQAVMSHVREVEQTLNKKILGEMRARVHGISPRHSAAPTTW